MRTLQVESELRVLRGILKDYISKNIYTPPKVLEIGYYEGGTAIFFDNLINNVHGLIVSIDNGKATPLTPVHTISKLVIIKDDSHNVSALKKASEYEPYDILFIDGDHEKNAAYLDYIMYKDIVRSGGLIIFHDITHNDVLNVYSGIINKNRFNHIEITFNNDIPSYIDTHGIGVIYKP